MTRPDEGTGPGRERELERRRQALVDAADAFGGDKEQRREVLMERAEARGLDRPAAEQAYDIAREEKLAPAYALAVVLEGISVRRLDGPRPDVDSTEPNEPEWVDTPPGRDQAERERRLRQTFRRLRSHMEEAESPAAALRAFAREPDLESYDF